MPRIKDLNSHAFARMYQQYENELYRIAYIYVQNEQDALDIMQEAAYRAYKNRSKLNHPQYFKTWLTRITINCAIDHIRKNSKILHLEDYAENLPALSFEEEQQIIMRTTLSALMTALEPSEKSVILLKYYEQLTFKEIADTLSLPLGTVKTTLYRALHKLRAAAKEDESE